MPEWAARQLLHPEERRGEGREGRGKGREGGMEGGRDAGRSAAEAGSRDRHQPPGPCCHPLPVPALPGKGKSRREAAWGEGGQDGTGTGLGY